MVKKINYLSNKNILEQLRLSNENNQATDELCRMFIRLAHRLSSKGNFVSYSFREEMESEGVLHMFSAWHKFDVEKSQNPFAFFTQVCKNAFIQVLNKEKKHRNIRDQLLVEHGMEPSNNYGSVQAKEYSERTRKEQEKRNKQIGQVYGGIKVLEYSHQTNKRFFYKCLCHCGKTKIMDLYSIRSGMTRSCGCLKKGPREHLKKTSDKSEKKNKHIGQVFNGIKILEFSHRSKYRVFYKCLCHCGKTKVMDLYAVRCGATKSCGCSKKGPKKYFKKAQEKIEKTRCLSI